MFNHYHTFCDYNQLKFCRIKIESIIWSTISKNYRQFFFRRKWIWMNAGNYVFVEIKQMIMLIITVHKQTHTAHSFFQLRILLYLTRENAAIHFLGQIHQWHYLPTLTNSAHKFQLSLLIFVAFVIKTHRSFLKVQPTNWNIEPKNVFWILECVNRVTGIKLEWSEQFTRNRSIDLVRHSNENNQTTEHKSKRDTLQKSNKHIEQQLMKTTI